MASTPPTGGPGRGSGRSGSLLAAVGVLPGNRRQWLGKAAWVGVWMFFLLGTVEDLWTTHRPPGAVAGGALGLLLFLAAYLLLVFRHVSKPLPASVVQAAVAVLYALAWLLSLTMGDAWIVLFVYVAVASGAVLPLRYSAWAIGGSVLAVGLIGTGFFTRPEQQADTGDLIPALLAGITMISARRTALTLRELRRARATVAQLAANEERLRLARDLHDLLGHSLSLITLKSELAGRMMPTDPAKAADQVADIERVSRQALVDVREAVSGYRRPSLSVELAGARTALDTAGISPELPRTAAEGGPLASLRLAPDQEGALAWALREAVTNVVRHSGASRCTVTLDRRTDAADETACLTVTDNGRGPSATAGGPASDGNGLAGLRERLALADGTLEVAPGAHGGFTLRATVPLAAAGTDGGAEGKGPGDGNGSGPTEAVRHSVP